MINEAFKQTDLKEMASPNIDGFHDFEWNTEEGDIISIQYSSIWHESLNQNIFVVNNSARSRTAIRKNQRKRIKFIKSKYANS